MLIPEARWLGSKLHSLPNSALCPLLNVGSQTRHFREVEQPWIEHYLFAPLRNRQCRILHLDLQQGEGIDIVGDLADAQFRARVQNEDFLSAICSNLLEHVNNPREVAHWLASLVRPGGYLFVSCPYRFPYHPDPIDTMFRPNVAELAGLFPNCQIVDQAIVNCGTYATFLATRELWAPGALCRSLMTRPAPAPQGDAQPSRSGRLFPWLFKSFRATCLILRKQ
ncbi:MAG: methyltransferase domain-containing protein [Opitutaceae bacterium]|nr:methyltransferase domain-containing protein [Opitutaceae bacterium]